MFRSKEFRQFLSSSDADERIFIIVSPYGKNIDSIFFETNEFTFWTQERELWFLWDKVTPRTLSLYDSSSCKNNIQT